MRGRGGRAERKEREGERKGREEEIAYLLIHCANARKSGGEPEIRN